MKVIISNQSELPIYAQIREQFKEQIISGQIKEGTALPSIRQLAKSLGVSVITTTRAYNELEEAGLIASVQGKGSIVLSVENNLMREQYLKRIEEGMEVAIDTAKLIRMPTEELRQIFNTMLEAAKQ